MVLNNHKEENGFILTSNADIETVGITDPVNQVHFYSEELHNSEIYENDHVINCISRVPDHRDNIDPREFDTYSLPTDVLEEMKDDILDDNLETDPTAHHTVSDGGQHLGQDDEFPDGEKADLRHAAYDFRWNPLEEDPEEFLANL